MVYKGINPNQQLTKNFNLSEFACKDFAKTPVPEELTLNAAYLAVQLQKIRDYLNLNLLRINSAYRTPVWNKNLGGASNSNHVKSTAADLTQYNISNDSFFSLIKKLVKEKIIPDGEIIKYDKFVHYSPHFEWKHFPIKANNFTENPGYSIPLFTYSKNPVQLDRFITQNSLKN